MIKKNFTNNKHEIYDLLFKNDSEIVNYSRKTEEPGNELRDIEDLFLCLRPVNDCLITELIKKPQWTILTHERKKDICLIIVNWDPEFRQISICKYKSIKDVVCENIFVSEIDLENPKIYLENIELYFFLYFFFGDFFHMLSIFDNTIEILHDGEKYTGKRSAILLLKSLRLSTYVRESDNFKINRNIDGYVFQFGDQVIRISRDGDCINKILLENG